MPDKDASTPRVFLIRHGQTLWSMSGQHTGKTDILMTAEGEDQVRGTGRMVYGNGKLLDPQKIAKVFVSPRTRAIRTYELLSGRNDGYEITESLAEWDYGEYEGLKPAEIRSKRKEQGLDTERPWDIWTDGCAGGESPAQVTARIDSLIAEIKKLQAPHMKDAEPKDVVLVAHGHLTRAFARRWLGYDLSFPLSLMMEPGGVGVLSYQHHNVEEPALLLGIGFPLQQ
ncbi:phosphoglycerate mutase-like protein [Sphaerulina musiva SO2202]|uniref:Phosphoglycerate mutase-like protein n=1 Tax=Sphaerulina musiva (strain SO2202) TaxID=692275 RepID=M3CKU5_SPHMS|nr:phosphoglycerate mutase-like protein [Sphaerulina musiva SO2202]EMF14388.1 phosphoglycerate mutase-like protein [Sphaerulina musiva SO2202]